MGTCETFVCTHAACAGAARTRANRSGHAKRTRSRLRLEAVGMANDVARRRAHVRLPARAGLLLAARVEAQPGDHHVGVAAVGVDGHPLARAGGAPGLEAGAVEGLLEQVRAVQRERDRPRAVIARVLPLAVPAAVPVRRG